ncbi:MAG: nucleotidyltransferase domain-containing protein [Candidatus Pacearchaeota archaeon]|nr:nucleotidyltransferase domain-containing protein [Candidatus Pacearchaeota archaeon]
MKSEIISKIKNKLGFLLSNKEVIDLIVFGSAVKGKSLPRDIDLAVLFYHSPTRDILDNIQKIDQFHISVVTAKDFFINPHLLINALLREGYSIKNKKSLSENLKFSSRVLFSYSLSSLSASNKVKVVNALRGKKGKPGMVKKNNGEWIVNQAFTVPIFADSLFEEFFNNLKIKYKKSYILMH